MCIEQIHSTLTRAAQSAVNFCSQSPTARVFILRRMVTNDFCIVDHQTYMAYRGTMKYSACSIIFAGGSAELTQLAAAVPPQLFGSSDPAASPQLIQNHEEF